MRCTSALEEIVIQSGCLQLLRRFTVHEVSTYESLFEDQLQPRFGSDQDDDPCDIPTPVFYLQHFIYSSTFQTFFHDDK